MGFPSHSKFLATRSTLKMTSSGFPGLHPHEIEFSHRADLFLQSAGAVVLFELSLGELVLCIISSAKPLQEVMREIHAF